jgi:uncharacterized protein (TIGR02271 family)
MMQESLRGVLVVREDGAMGKISAVTTSRDGSTMAIIRFEDGAEVAVSPEMLSRQVDGSYRLLLAASHLEMEDAIVIPVVAEEVQVGTSQVPRGIVRVHKRVETEEQVVDAPVAAEEVRVERVQVNTLVEGAAPQIREEDGVVIIPVLEEVLVVEKRLMLREEVRLTRRVTNTSVPQTVRLRQEVVDIERVELGGPDLADATRQNVE